MPGRHQLIYAYPNFQGGADVWCSSGWWPAGQWFYVWNTPKPIGVWHTTAPWRWVAKGWRFWPEAPWDQLSAIQKIYTDVQLSRSEAMMWPPPVLFPGGAKGFVKGGYDQALTFSPLSDTFVIGSNVTAGTGIGWERMMGIHETTEDISL